MAVTPPTAVAPPHHHAEQPRQVTVISHSNLFYWWPVWAVGFLMAALTFLDDHRMAILHKGSTTVHNASGDVKSEQGSSETKTTINGQDVIILPKGQELQPDALRLHISTSPRFGVLFATVLLLVIVITNVPLRGMWSMMIIVLIILLVVVLALFDAWDRIFHYLGLLDIRINAGGYLFISAILFGIWLITIVFFDRQLYIVFTPGQLKVCTEIGGGEKVYDAMGMKLEKQRSDLFRHWILGLGSGDLIVRTAGSSTEHIDLPNVLFIGRKVQMIEEMMQKRAIVSGK